MPGFFATGELSIYTVTLLTPFAMCQSCFFPTYPPFNTGNNAHCRLFQGITPTLIAVQVEGDTSAQISSGSSESGSHTSSRILSHVVFRRTVRQDDTVDINGNGIFDHGDSPIDCSVDREGHTVRNEKTSSDTPL